MVRTFNSNPVDGTVFFLGSIVKEDFCEESVNFASLAPEKCYPEPIPTFSKEGFGRVFDEILEPSCEEE